MKVISMINLKGGVGKTFTTIQMSDLLYKSGYKILLIDNDKQGNLSKFYGKYEDTKTCNTAKLLKGENRVKELVQPTEYEGIYIISANMSLLTMTLQVSGSKASDQHLRFTRILAYAALQKIDFIIIDNPPDMGINVVNSLMISDEVIVPLRIDEWSLEGLEIVLNQIKEAMQFNSKLSFRGALITHYKNNNVNKAGVQWLEANGYKLFSTKIRLSPEIASESTFFHKPVCRYNSRCGLAVDYRKFVYSYLGGA